MQTRQLSAVVKPTLELTLAILKPDVCRHPNVCDAIKRLIVDNGFYFVRSKITRLTESEAEKFYAEHRDKFFYNRLVTFIRSGLLSVHAIARENAINEWRKMMGPTKVYIARHEQPNCIRAQFGLSDTRNATHGSDSVDSANHEINFFFPDFDVNEWYRNEEIYFRNKENIEFVADQWLHRIKYENEKVKALN